MSRGIRARLDEVWARKLTARFGGGFLFFWLSFSLVGSQEPPEPGAPDPGSRPAEESGPPKSSEKDPGDGKALLELTLKAHGGADRLAAMTSLTWDALSSQRTGDGQVHLSNRGHVVFPDRFRWEQSTSSWRTVTSVVGETGWRLRERFPPGQPKSRDLQDIPEAEARRTLASLRLSTTVLLRDHAQLQVREDPRAEVKGKEYRVLVVNRGSGETVRLYIDPQSGRIARRKGIRRASGGTETREEEMWDYRDVNGIWLPYSRAISIDGERRQVLSVNRYEINIEIPADLFDRPPTSRNQGSNP